MSLITRKQKKKPVVDDDWDDLDDYTRKVQDNQDNNNAFILPVILMTAVSTSVSLLSDEDKQQLKDTIFSSIASDQESATGTAPTTEEIQDTLPNDVPILDVVIHDPEDQDSKDIVSALTDQEIQEAMAVGGEIRSDWLASDPQTQENIDANNMQGIMEQVGMFGSIEAQKGASLESYQLLQNSQGYMAYIPWVPVGDESTCDDCWELADKGPYPVDNFPEPPHYGCRCNEEMAEPILVPIGTDIEDVQGMMEE